MENIKRTPTQNEIQEVARAGLDHSNNLNADTPIDRLDIANAYACGWLKHATNQQQEQPTEAKEPVYIRKDDDGTPVGVAVQTIDERFEIALKDIDNGREMTWDDAMKFKLPTKKQASIICAYLDDINAKLKEAGGEPLDKWYWTSSEFNAYTAWFYTGFSGLLPDFSKDSTCSVRPVLAF